MKRLTLRSCATLPLCSTLYVGSVLLSGCSQKQPEVRSFTQYVDTTVSVYGPYAAVKLPLTRGVKVANPIQISLGPENFIYVANQTGEIYSLRDTDDDGLEDMALLYCDVKELGLRSPAGFAAKGDTVFIGTAQQIRAFRDVDKDGKADTSWVFFDDIPNSEHPYEWTSAMNFGPDGWLYCAMTTDSWNAAPSPDPRGYRGSIVRIAPDGNTCEPVATGIRSVYGMVFKSDGDGYFTDNEGGGNTKEELNLLVKNSFYGHNPAKYKFDTVTAPVYALSTEIAPSGMEFNREDNDFGDAAGDLFIAFYGPGERWSRGGIGRLRIGRDSEGRRTFDEFPVADIPKLSDLAFGNDGALYAAQHGKADYWYNAVYEDEGNIYKLIHDPSSRYTRKVRSSSATPLTKDAVRAGEQLYAEYACLACHAVDGTTELLGPNLKDIGQRLSREEILEEIMYPSRRIKPSMGAVRVLTNDKKVLIGRVVNANESQISLMMVGNHVVNIPRNEIEKTEEEKKSLMYEGLLTNMSDSEKEVLLNYVISLSRQ